MGVRVREYFIDKEQDKKFFDMSQFNANIIIKEHTCST